MKKLKIGILGTSDIAFRRFLPALKKNTFFEYAGVASRTLSKTQKFVEAFGAKGYGSYEELIEDTEVDSIYIPLPPALHREWAMKALARKKHVLIEKPFTTNANDTDRVIAFAKENNLAVQENYMFLYHTQFAKIRELIVSGSIGEIRLYRMTFGFPKRSAGDFRYNKELGGGALFDCGGYPVRLALELLGDSASVMTSKLNRADGYDVDLYGSATLENSSGQVAQIAFGMDNAYRCEFEAWGNGGILLASRIFTAGTDFAPEFIIKSASETIVTNMPPDDQFLNSINAFNDCIQSVKKRDEMYQSITRQSLLIEKMNGSGYHG